MIQLADLLDDCEKLVRKIRIEDRRADLSRLLKFESNLNEPIHRWFKFKEGFSSGLVRWLLTEYPPCSRQSVAFLDPFCGVGTSLLAAEETLGMLGVRRIILRGVEVNPYMAFVASTKLDWHRYNPAVMMRAAAISMNGLHLSQKPPVPSLSTLQNEKFVDAVDLQRLLELRDKIRLVTKGHFEQRPLLLGLAAGADRVFKLRKDGRALRFSPRSGQISVDDEISRCWSEIAEDLQLGKERSDIDYHIVKEDGRRADKIFDGRRFQVILFSPPYLNNIDYTEVYKIELWLLEFLKSRAQMVAQRRRTFRSHPSCLFPEFEDASVHDVIELLGSPFRRLLSYAGASEKWRERLFGQYFADMLRTLRACRRLLAPGGRVFVIVGNSLHGTSEYPIPVATDVWTARLARGAGLLVESLIVGRQLARRQNVASLLRESIIVMSRE